METQHGPIPTPGDWIRTDHHCWWGDPSAEHPAVLHNDPVKVDRVVRLKTGYRIEVTRCDGTPMHLVTDRDGRERLLPWDAAQTGYQILPAHEVAS